MSTITMGPYTSTGRERGLVGLIVRCDGIGLVEEDPIPDMQAGLAVVEDVIRLIRRVGRCSYSSR